MSVKKAFQPIVNLLESNRDKKVSSIIDDVLALASAKTRSASANTVHRDENGSVVAILDYYFKLWMPLSHVEFGAKAGSASGFNTMCKEGVSNWTKQNRDFKKGKDSILDQIMSSEITVDEATKLNEALEEAKKVVLPHSAGIGFETLEELLEADVAVLDEMVADAQATADAAEAETEDDTSEE